MTNRILSYFLGLGMVVLFAVSAQGYPLTAALNSAQVVPLNNSTARGNCKINAYWGDIPGGLGFDVNCDFSGLSGALIDADIRSASSGQNGGGVCNEGEKQVRVTLPNTGSGNVTIACGFWEYWETWTWTNKRFYVVLQTSNFPDGEVRGQMKPGTLDSDVNGEGRAEISVFRPSDGVSYAHCGLTGSTIMKRLDWNSQTDSDPYLADLDYDGIADWSFIRTNPAGNMFIMFRSSRDDLLQGIQFGNANYGDMQVFGDYNGDGKIGAAVFRPSNGNWYSTEGAFYGVHWGQAGDTPCAGDYDGDGKADLCVVRPEDGHLVWYIYQSSDNQLYAAYWGLATDTVYSRNAVDVDGDGRSDVFVSREEKGQRVFYALRSSDSSMFALQWGLSTDTVKIGDYDNDGKTDLASIREVDGHLVWYIWQSADGQMRAMYWGLPGDL